MPEPSSKNSSYADVSEMFRRLKLLDEGSLEFRRQREAIVERCRLAISPSVSDPLAHLVGGDRAVGLSVRGLVNAVNRFDVDTGVEFLSFAVPTMMGEVRRHFRDYGWAVKVPRRIKELQPQMIRARAELSQRLQRAPNATEIADHLGNDRELIIEATIGGKQLLNDVNRCASATECRSQRLHGQRR